MNLKLIRFTSELISSYNFRLHLNLINIWLGIAIPSSLPFLIAGFRLSSGRALSAVVIAEFLIGTGNGLGIHIMRLAQTFKHNEAIVALFILTFAGLFLAVGVESLVRRFLPWFRK